MPLVCKDYEPFSPEQITEVFGPKMAADILEENRKDAAAGIRGELLQQKWEDICREIAQLPDPEQLEDLYKKLGIKATLAEIEVSADLADTLLENSPMVRNRLTFMRLRKCLKYA